MEEQSIMPFEGTNIRKIWHEEQWYFSIVDVVELLSETPKPTAYWNKVQKSIAKESQFYPFWIKLKMKGIDGKNYSTDCTNTEGVFRILMSVPSPKAEPLKLWLANLGKQAIDEAENPELLTERQAEIYKAKGYPEEWIKRRVQSIETRKALTDEWKNRGVKEGQEYAILTATIAKGTFGLTPSEHSGIKGLEKQNLRDHMTPLELVFTALSEEITRSLSVRDDAQGFNENYDTAHKGGNEAGKARLNLEKNTRLKVISSENFLNPPKTENEALLENKD